MAAKTTSVWRLSARQIIARILAALPPDATLKAKRKALRDGYPWSRVGWAYKAWCVEQRAALSPFAAKAGPAVVDWTVGKPPTFYVRVRCDWCGSSLSGCLACGRLVEQWRELCENADANAMIRAAQAAPDDPLPRLIFADWHEERGFDRLAELFRATCKEKS